MPFVDSAALKSLWYDEKRRTLRATFRDTGRTYVYEDVTPGEYDALIGAGSKGAWFNAHIRNNHAFHEA
ncbi:MAG: KTSC domain-containing protein [Rhizomicrobium sp.]